jgi:hypothetical protein
VSDQIGITVALDGLWRIIVSRARYDELVELGHVVDGEFGPVLTVSGLRSLVRVELAGE